MKMKLNTLLLPALVCLALFALVGIAADLLRTLPQAPEYPQRDLANSNVFKKLASVYPGSKFVLTKLMKIPFHNCPIMGYVPFLLAGSLGQIEH